MEFRKDVVIDIVCYRKLGHNEQDTPAMTQPLMYKKIAAHPGVRSLYAERLVSQGVVTPADVDALVTGYRARMDAGTPIVSPVMTNVKSQSALQWQPILKQQGETEEAVTAMPVEELKRLSERITTMPEWLTLHPLVERVIRDRAAMGRGEMLVDWGMAEHLAYASLVSAGFSVRLAGEDSGRGTFVHRHAELHDQNRERWDAGVYIPLQHVSKNQANFTVINSPLSEEAALAFEYGFATSAPNTLTLWEAQFGDFANGAQVVIDQFISSGEAKWGRACGLVMLLPHGFEGQAGTFLGASGTVSASVCRQQYGSRAADDGGADFPCPASPDAQDAAQAADRHGAEVAVAAQGCRLAAVGVGGRCIQARC